MAIYFHSKVKGYAWLSNFSLHGFEADGVYWPSVEHYYQAAKFALSAPEYAEQIRLVAEPSQAKSMARSHEQEIPTNWEELKDNVMRKAVSAKFAAHPELQAQLLLTGEEVLIEKVQGDAYWGCGRDGTGKNMLGIILMEVRECLRVGKVSQEG